MAKYGGKDFALSFAAQVMTAHILSINGFDVEAVTIDGKPFGTAYPKPIPTGDVNYSDIEVSGLYDDTATTGPDAVFRGNMPTGPASAASALVLTWGGAKTSTGTAFCVKYTRKVTKNQITEFTATLRISGQMTEA
ncbi:MAG TPA: hypothetical protein VN803_06870 [Gemmatimonadales bacterium]|nr:hypothetical protein [Gemmatimonadales bacterium]